MQGKGRRILNDEDTKSLARRLALENSVQHDGKTISSIVVGKILASRVDLRTKAKELKDLVEGIVNEVNMLSLEEQKRLLALQEGTIQEKRIVEKTEKLLSALPNAEKYASIHVRFSPNPDGALHLGNARAAILCDEYAKMYKGRFTLRFDDTDPKIKTPMMDAYEWIKEDLRWLGVTWHDIYYQSDRLKTYYGFIEKLLSDGNAYVCNCRIDDFRRLITNREPCPCRNLAPEYHSERWNKMLDGSYKEGEVVVRVKTDLDHPNPAVRDWPAFRIIDVKTHPHPRTGSTFCVWPLFAFCCGIDDHELQITHVIRGKEHMTNSVRQSYLYRHLGWVEPDAVHYGRLRIIGTVLSKSRMKEGLTQGFYSGWDDPRLGTLTALRKRGFLPETVRNLMVDVGPKPVDATISWVNVESVNRKLLDPKASRYFFVADPILMRVTGLTHSFNARLKRHPNDQKMGYREMNIVPDAGEASVLVSKRDNELLTLGAQIRLMELFNVQVEARNDSILARFTGESYQEAREQKAPLIHWVPSEEAVPAKVIMPDATILKGLAESTCLELKINDIIQFERFGFARINTTSPEIVACYAHR